VREMVRALLMLVLQVGLASSLAFYPVSDRKPKTPLKRALDKKVGVAVALEVAAGAEDTLVNEGEDRRTATLTAHESLTKLSGELRGGREGQLASALFADDVEAVSVLATEQASAKGDFPGPCPVVYCGDPEHAQAAVAAGAAGVVMPVDALDSAKEICREGAAEIVWDVSSAEQVDTIVANEGAPEDCFLLEAHDFEALVGALPSGAVALSRLRAMQPDDGEIELGRSLMLAGCKSILVERACVGDAEDLPYARYAVKALTSKRSSAFAIDGHTGAVNGHFGGRSQSVASPEDGWQRVRAR